MLNGYMRLGSRLCCCMGTMMSRWALGPWTLWLDLSSACFDVAAMLTSNKAALKTLFRQLCSAYVCLLATDVYSFRSPYQGGSAGRVKIIVCSGDWPAQETVQHACEASDDAHVMPHLCALWLESQEFVDPTHAGWE